MSLRQPTRTEAFWYGYILGLFVTLALLGIPIYHCLSVTR